MKNHPDLFWAVVSSMYLGNVMLLVLNLPLIPVWVQVLKVPEKVLYPLVLLFCLIGSYSMNFRVVDMVVMLAFGGIGYLMKKYQYDGGPLILAFILGLYGDGPAPVPDHLPRGAGHLRRASVGPRGALDRLGLLFP